MAHYYTRDGSSCHEVMAKNGNMRATNITDARKLGLVPSVTTVKDTGAPYNLINWMLSLVIDQTITLPHLFTDLSIEDYKKEILRAYRVAKEKPAIVGNAVHDSMEKLFKGKGFDDNKHFTEKPYNLILETFPGVMWRAEDSFSHPKGFGGRVDLWGKDDNGNSYIIDFKTKNKEVVDEKMQYDDHKIQLAAYQAGLQLPGNTRRFNLFISVHENTPGECCLVESKEFDKYLNIFYTLVKLWQQRNNYDSSY